MLMTLYGKVISPSEEEEYMYYMSEIPQECYRNLSSLIASIEKLELTKREKEFVINTIHRLFGFIGTLEDEINDSIEFNHVFIQSLNLPRVLDRVLKKENSKEIREEYAELYN